MKLLQGRKSDSENHIYPNEIIEPTPLEKSISEGFDKLNADLEKKMRELFPEWFKDVENEQK